MFCTVCGVPVASDGRDVLPRRTAHALQYAVPARGEKTSGGSDLPYVCLQVLGVCVLLLYMVLALSCSLYRSEFVDWGYSVR